MPEVIKETQQEEKSHYIIKIEEHDGKKWEPSYEEVMEHFGEVVANTMGLSTSS